MRLKRSRYASTSIDYPMLTGRDPQDDTDGIPFICEGCGYEFFVSGQVYRGERDHPPNVPVCPECREKNDE